MIDNVDAAHEALRLALVGHTAGARSGAVKWCKRCSRRHGTRERCDLSRDDRGHYVHARKAR